MKNLILVAFLFISLGTFAQTSLYSQGFRVGSDLAKACDNPNRHQLYLATTSGNYPLEYLAGVNEGWAANANACDGDPVVPVNTTNPGHAWYCSMFGIFCHETNDNGDE